MVVVSSKRPDLDAAPFRLVKVFHRPHAASAVDARLTQVDARLTHEKVLRQPINTNNHTELAKRLTQLTHGCRKSPTSLSAHHGEEKEQNDAHEGSGGGVVKSGNRAFTAFTAFTPPSREAVREFLQRRRAAIVTWKYGPDGTVLNYEESKKADDEFWAGVERAKVS
jgi:hypothetical protein